MIMLNEQSIDASLQSCVQHLKSGNFEQAQLAIASDFLGLHRLRGMHAFGADRTDETVELVDECLGHIENRNATEALEAAKAAVSRWNRH